MNVQDDYPYEFIIIFFLPIYGKKTMKKVACHEKCDIHMDVSRQKEAN